FEETELKMLYKRLGNMALLKKSLNSGIGNAGFMEKRPYYAESEYILTKGVENYKVWNSGTISKRQHELAKLAVKAWQIQA
ncbi:MAG: HNH endonuclease family protein, partial [Candidatus Omnitrophica bacterium]|nr:HNH endonuclease family protein [Candidatus Omnitrophota bacterium]